LSTPYFAPGVFSSYLAEGAARVTFFPKTTPALFYAALGLAESPFGYLTPWVRAEAAFPVPLGASRLTLKGKVYYAAREFYTPKNTFSPARFKAMGNAVAAIPLGSALSMTAGLSLSWDDASRQGQARAALSFAALGFSAGVNGFFNAWKIPETGGLVTESDTTAGGGLTLGAALPSAKLGFTGTCKVYPGAKTPKTEYSAAFTAAPREKKVKKGEKPPPQFIPDCRLRFDGATKAGVFSGEITAAASWDFLAKGISVAIKLEAVAPLAD
jgi:hypothetical protein